MPHDDLGGLGPGGGGGGAPYPEGDVALESRIERLENFVDATLPLLAPTLEPWTLFPSLDNDVPADFEQALRERIAKGPYGRSSGPEAFAFRQVVRLADVIGDKPRLARAADLGSRVEHLEALWRAVLASHQAHASLVELTGGLISDAEGARGKTVAKSVAEPSPYPASVLARAAAFQKAIRLHAQLPSASSTSAGGVSGATVRGEEAKLQWVRDGTLVEAKRLAQSWGLTTQALGVAAKRGEVCTLKVANKLYYPGVFVSLEREPVAEICRALGRLTPSEKMIFWTRAHGGLAGKTAQEALEAHIALDRIVEIAGAWASEREA